MPRQKKAQKQRILNLTNNKRPKLELEKSQSPEKGALKSSQQKSTSSSSSSTSSPNRPRCKSDAEDDKGPTAREVIDNFFKKYPLKSNTDPRVAKCHEVLELYGEYWLSRCYQLKINYCCGCTCQDEHNEHYEQKRKEEAEDNEDGDDDIDEKEYIEYLKQQGVEYFKQHGIAHFFDDVEFFVKSIHPCQPAAKALILFAKFCIREKYVPRWESSHPDLMTPLELLEECSHVNLDLISDKLYMLHKQKWWTKLEEKEKVDDQVSGSSSSSSSNTNLVVNSSTNVGKTKSSNSTKRAAPEDEETEEPLSKDALPIEFIHRKVQKEFPPHGIFKGVVKSYDAKEKFFQIEYEDGDEEEMTMEELKTKLIVPVSVFTKSQMDIFLKQGFKVPLNSELNKKEAYSDEEDDDDESDDEYRELEDHYRGWITVDKVRPDGWVMKKLMSDGWPDDDFVCDSFEEIEACIDNDKGVFLRLPEEIAELGVKGVTFSQMWLALRNDIWRPHMTEYEIIFTKVEFMGSEEAEEEDVDEDEEEEDDEEEDK